ncbi:peptidylprolyl isomerase [Oleiagrimonas sp.]|jgi:cyclophilin family peptidyl-prolyl cis-trans isomerase|uniref:peptidylprolyl isomerase n=1 Tax=Oleiagrimonas sp. TaxID=2010330 RepID=UPI00260446F6|nr:peptidylprolyl isomerase [Oleiagrimonas sp.]MDA3914114.1 peptidylprolyl isomerase [Oleiagrimonas sp.]
MRNLRLPSFALLCLSLVAFAAMATTHDSPTQEQIIKHSRPSEWHTLDPANTLYMDLPSGRVVIELAPQWSPRHVANIKTLVHEHYFDHTSVYRVVDNFVAQWGDPDGDDPAKAKPMGSAKTTLPPEFVRHVHGPLPFVPLGSPDVYAPEVGFSGDFPVGRDPSTHTAWIAHCYGTVGVARDVAPDSGNGNTLYAVIGNARRIDRNLAVAGRVVRGMPLLSSLPRGPKDHMGVYRDLGRATPILKMRLASDLPADQRLPLQIMRTDSASFRRLLHASAHKHNAFYRYSPGHIDLCAVAPPVRLKPKAATSSSDR